MSDEPTSAHPGTLSPRNIDTVTYKVLGDGTKLPFAIGETFSAWPQGEVFACVSGIGLGVVKNGEIEEWVKAKLIERVARVVVG